MYHLIERTACYTCIIKDSIKMQLVKLQQEEEEISGNLRYAAMLILLAKISCKVLGA